MDLALSATSVAQGWYRVRQRNPTTGSTDSVSSPIFAPGPLRDALNASAMCALSTLCLSSVLLRNGRQEAVSPCPRRLALNSIVQYRARGSHATVTCGQRSLCGPLTVKRPLRSRPQVAHLPNSLLHVGEGTGPSEALNNRGKGNEVGQQISPAHRSHPW